MTEYTGDCITLCNMYGSRKAADALGYFSVKFCCVSLLATAFFNIRKQAFFHQFLKNLRPKLLKV